MLFCSQISIPILYWDTSQILQEGKAQLILTWASMYMERPNFLLIILDLNLNYK